MTKRRGAKRAEHMVAVLKEWQGIERKAISDLGEILEKTPSPLIRILMEIIRHDSIMHHRVQQFLVDGVTLESPSVTREDIATVWSMIEEHDHAEKKTIELAKELLEDAWTPVQKQLIEYLLQDETKHDALLIKLNDVKKAMSRSSGA